MASKAGKIPSRRTRSSDDTARTNTKGRTFDDISAAIGDPLRDFLTGPHSPELITLGMELATAAKVDLDPAMLTAQVKNTKLTGYFGCDS